MNRNFIFLLAVFILISGGLFAQTAAQELRVGSFINGNLNQGQEIWYSVRPAQSGLLTVETSSNFDTYLEAYDAQRNYITGNDDWNGVDSLIRLPVQANTTYLFKLTGYGGYSSGSFRIIASFEPVTELRPGSNVSGNIASGQDIWYSVRAAQSGYIIVETAGNLDTYLLACDEYLNYLNEDDDSAEYPNARVKINVKAGSLYYFKLNCYGSGGSYRILANNETYPAPNPLAAGSFLSGSISENNEVWYSVQVRQNGYLTVETSGYTDTVLEAYDSDYNFLVYDDDGAGYPNARIKLNAVSGRTYLFKLTGFNSGAYRIFAIYESYPVPSPLSAGSYQSGYIENEAEYWFSVRTASSGNLVVETAGSTDTYLEVYDQNYNLISYNDDYYDHNARIELFVEPNQTFIFKLRGYSSYTSGSYRIFAGME